jgi:hypothetical protein
MFAPKPLIGFGKFRIFWHGPGARAVIYRRFVRRAAPGDERRRGASPPAVEEQKRGLFADLSHDAAYFSGISS